MIISPNLSPGLRFLLLDAGSKELDPELPGHCQMKEMRVLCLEMGRAGCDQLDQAQDQQRSTLSYLSIISCWQHSAHYYLVFSVFTGTRGQVEEQLCCLFLTKCIVCYWQFCVNLKNSKNQYWFMTLWLAGAGWKSWEWLVLPSAGNCSQITDRVSLKAGWILLSGPGAITTW